MKIDKEASKRLGVTVLRTDSAKPVQEKAKKRNTEQRTSEDDSAGKSSDTLGLRDE